MKVELKKDQTFKLFCPFTVEVTIEQEAELIDLYSVARGSSPSSTTHGLNLIHNIVREGLKVNEYLRIDE